MDDHMWLLWTDIPTDLKDLQIGDTVQIQNQKGNEPLRWDKSGVVIERRAHNQYTVRMDGSGRMTLRNRWFLRKIRPAFNRSVLYNEMEGDQARTGDDLLRRSSRARAAVQRFQA